MNAMNIEIIPMLSLDPELIFHRTDRTNAFTTVFGQTTLAQAKSFGTFRLYRASDILKEGRAVAEFFFRALDSGREIISLQGGYAFLDGEQFLFGAEHAYPFYKNWERAFEHIAHTSPVDVIIDQHTTKLIKKGSEILINRGTIEIVVPFATFLSRAANAVDENKTLRRELAAELRRRLGTAECDLINQLE